MKKEQIAIPVEKVESSQINAIGYDKQTKTLAIKFNNDKLYYYENVDEELYSGLMKAESHGKYFNSMIKCYPNIFPFTKIS